MQYKKYRIATFSEAAEKTYIIRIIPDNPDDFLSFKAGQYVSIKNPSSITPDEVHPISIASSPTDNTSLEFCIKIVGDWTDEITKLPEKSALLISEAEGNFTWEDTITNVVFLVGGLGIAPVISLLRYVKDTKKTPDITLLYGIRAPEFVPYQDELKSLTESIHLKLIYIYSHVDSSQALPARLAKAMAKRVDKEGYRGLITEAIIQKEIDLSKNPDFFVIGPPVFISHIHTELRNLSVSDNKFRTEHLIQTK